MGVVYEIPETESVIERLRVRETALKEGRDDKPSRSDKQLDAPQKQIIEFFSEHMVSKRSDTNAALSNLEKRRDELEVEIDHKRIEGIEDETRTEIRRIYERFRPELQKIFGSLRQRNRNYKYFRAENQLSRDPVYPDSKPLHWSILIALVVVESIANSYFFSKGSDLGLLGGIFQAFLISCVNVGVALFLGVLPARQLNHVDKVERVKGRIFMCLGVAALFLFNLAAAHYRSELELDPLQAIVNAIPRLMANPFGLDNFDSWMLLLIGHIFAFAGGLKGYLSDDTYPGYGAIHRAMVEAQDFYDDVKHRVRYAVDDAVDDYHTNLDARRLAIIAMTREYRTLINQSETTVDDFNLFKTQVEENMNNVLEIYRKANREVRDSEAPDYFNARVVLGSVGKLTRPETTRLFEKADAYEAKLDTLGDLVRQSHELLREINNKAFDEISAFIKQVESEFVDGVSDEPSTSSS